MDESMKTLNPLTTILLYASLLHLTPFSALLLPAHLQCASELLVPCSGNLIIPPKWCLDCSLENGTGVVLSAGVVGGDFNVLMSHLQRRSVYGRFQRLQLLKSLGLPAGLG